MLPPGGRSRKRSRPSLRLRLWLAGTALALGFAPWTVAQAQSPTLNELRGKVFDARMVQKMFANGLRFCNVLDGTNFYFAPQNRVLDLKEYHRSVESLAGDAGLQSGDPAAVECGGCRSALTKGKTASIARPRDLRVVASLPELEKRLEEMEEKCLAPQR
jgi:hypothetical protein